MTPHILVLGANGFVGSHFVEQALQMGWNVDGAKRESSHIQAFENIKNYYSPNSNKDIDTLNRLKSNLTEFADAGPFYSKSTPNKKGQFKWINVDLNDTVELVSIFQFPYDYIVNTAAMISFNTAEDDIMIQTNTQIAKNLVNACIEAKCQRLVHFSSIAALGRPENDEDISIDTIWTDSDFNTPYALSKYLSEMEIWRGAHEGLNVLVVNPGVIMGYSTSKTSSTQIIQAANSANPFVPKGSNGFIFVEDLVLRTLNLMLSTDSWQRRHLMVSHNISFSKMFQIINETYGIKRLKTPLKQPIYSLVFGIVAFIQFFKIPIPLSTHLLKSTRKMSRYKNTTGATQSRKMA